MDYFDLSKDQSVINFGILRELVDRTVKGQSLFEGMREFILSLDALSPRRLEEPRLTLGGRRFTIQGLTD